MTLHLHPPLGMSVTSVDHPAGFLLRVVHDGAAITLDEEETRALSIELLKLLNKFGPLRDEQNEKGCATPSGWCGKEEA